MVRKLTGVVFAVSTMHAAVVSALGLGEVELNSALNQPLEAQINLLNVGDLNEEQIRVKMASPEDFDRAGVDKAFFLSDVRFSIELDGKGGGVVKVRTNKLVREPFLNFVLEARWPNGRLLREYTLLMDLPAFTDQAVATPAPAKSSAAQVAPRPAPAPASQPRRSAAAPAAAPRPLPEGTVKTTGNDTLWGIAASYRPSDASVQQTMMAIYEKNPEAFNRNNINGLKRGQVLEMPSNAEIQALSHQQAVRAASEQNQSWSSGATIAAGRGEQSTRSGSAGDESYLKLSNAGTDEATSGGSSGAGTSGSSAAMRGELAAAEENLDRLNRENDELESRMTDLQEQVETLQKLVELKDNQLSSMQQRLADGEQLSAEELAVIEAAEAEAGLEPGAEEVDLNFEQPEFEAVEEGAGAENTETAAAAPVPEPRKPAKPVVTVKDDVEPGLLETLMQPLYLAGLGAIAACGVALAVLRRRQTASATNDEALDFGEFDADAIGGGLFADEPAEETTAETEDTVVTPALDTEDEVKEEAVQAADDSDEPEDPIAEAEIYCSYNRHDEAIELLNKAIGREPGRSELYLKLLGILADQDKQEDFAETYGRLQQTGDQDAVHLAQELVSGKDDASAWMGGDAADSDVADLESISSTDDFDLDISLDDSNEDVTESREALDVDDSLEFDLGTDEPTEETLEATDDESQDNEDKAEDTLEFDVGDLDLDLADLDDSPELSNDDIDLDLSADLDFDTSDTEEPSIELADDDSTDPAAELDDLEFELDDLTAGEAEAESSEEPTAALADIDNILESGSDIDDDLGELADGDEVATKLDLARAYIDMGDVDGARDILDEVIQEGSDDQKDEANSLLNNLAS